MDSIYHYKQLLHNNSGDLCIPRIEFPERGSEKTYFVAPPKLIPLVAELRFNANTSLRLASMVSYACLHLTVYTVRLGNHCQLEESQARE